MPEFSNEVACFYVTFIFQYRDLKSTGSTGRLWGRKTIAKSTSKQEHGPFALVFFWIMFRKSSSVTQGLKHASTGRTKLISNLTMAQQQVRDCKIEKWEKVVVREAGTGTDWTRDSKATDSSRAIARKINMSPPEPSCITGDRQFDEELYEVIRDILTVEEAIMKLDREEAIARKGGVDGF